MTISGRRQHIYADVPPEAYQLVPPMPSTLMLDLSNGCNHRCVFCANPQMTRPTTQIARGLASRILAEARSEGVEEVGFYTTGDPFIHRDLALLTAEASRLGFRYIFVSTNGALATPERTKAVIDAGLHSFKFSINAGTRETYRLIHGRDDFETVLAHLRFVSEYRKTLDRPLSLYVTFVVTAQNAHEVEAFREFVGPLVDDVYASPCGTQSGQMAQAADLLGASLTADVTFSICRLPFHRMHVSAEGYLTLCCVDYQNYVAVADLSTMSLGEAWRSEAAQEARRRHLTQDLAGTLCGHCWQGSTAPIHPLQAALASPVNFVEFHRTAETRVSQRLGIPAGREVS